MELGMPARLRELIGNRYRWGRLLLDTEGSVLIETVIVLPVLIIFMTGIMELCLLMNARSMANYAAFCAARTIAVQGLNPDNTEKAHFAAALALTPVSPETDLAPAAVLAAYGIPEPDHTLQVLERLMIDRPARLASALVRTSEITCDTGLAMGARLKHLTVNVTYIHRCAVFPLGRIWGSSGLAAQLARLRSLPFYNLIQPAVARMQDSSGWELPVHGRAIIDYWL